MDTEKKKRASMGTSPLEVWRDVPGWVGIYRVSSLGRVMRCEKYRLGRAGKMRYLKDKILKASVSNSGYPRVGLCSDSKYDYYHVHRLVLWAFVGPPAKGLIARHLDGNKLNNHLTNLAWGTYKENSNDQLLHGTRVVGESTIGSKLTETNVKAIRLLVAKGMWQRLVADKFGITQSSVSRIVSRENWAHVKEIV